MLIKTTDELKILELEQRCFKNPYSLNIINDIIKTHECFLIWYDHNIVGYIIVLKLDDSYELIRIGVIKEMRNKSIAKLALKEFINNYNSNIYLEVNVNNANAVKLYKSIGFVEIGIRKKYYTDNSDAIVMLYKN